MLTQVLKKKQGFFLKENIRVTNNWLTETVGLDFPQNHFARVFHESILEMRGMRS